MERALVVLRESLDILAEGYGFDIQLDEVKRFFQEHDLVADRIVKLIENSTTWDRDEFESLVFDAIDRRFEVPWLVFPRVDRFARKADAAAYYLGLLRKAGLKLGFARENLVVTNETGSMEFLMLSFQTAKADEDAKTIKANTMGGRLKRAKERGRLPNGGHRWCFDYDKATGKAVINSEKANHVRNWARWLIEEGVSLGECCRRMEALGVPAPKGGLRWRPGTLTRILKDRALIGKFYAYKEKMVGEEGRVKKRRECQKEPLLVYEDDNTVLESVIFEDVQRRLRKNIELSQRNVRFDYTPTRGFIFCGTCGRRLTGVAFRGVPYFRCPVCRKPSIKAEAIWEAVSGEIKHILLDPELFYEALSKYLNTGMSAAQLEREITQLETQLANLDEVDTKILRLYLITNYPENKLRIEHERIEKHKVVLSDKVRHLKAELADLRRVRLTREVLAEHSRWFQSEVAHFTEQAWRGLLAQWEVKVIIDGQKQASLQMRSPSTNLDTSIPLNSELLCHNDGKRW